MDELLISSENERTTYKVSLEDATNDKDSGITDASMKSDDRIKRIES